MSKINQIQQALLELGDGAFQKIADAYLVEKGFGRVNSIGSVVAANKVKRGTPDTLVATPKGNYVFAEHTTQQTGLLDKMKGDLRKCFDEGKTGIPGDKIERVVFCFTGRLNADEENELAKICQKNGVNLDLFGIDALAFDLYSKYPGLALDFLGVHIDTGQIVPPERFVSLYNRSKLATRLDLNFHFRGEELSRLLEALESERLVVLSGRAGVGKSRLALEVCKRFSEAHSEYEVMCVFGRNRDLWEDLQTRFRRPGNFLIFVDDANRVSRFEYIVDCLLHQREDQQIKVVATVRDYALSTVREAARPVGGGAEEELGLFTDDQIKGLVTDEYRITNHHYLERIADIARGNPRLAVMAAEVAKERPLSSIYDVSSLYDSYFSSIREDLKGEGADLGNTNLLKVAAIVSFFKAVDRTNEEMTSAIEEAFHTNPAAFWEAADSLHELEVLDMHENEVVRVSDQVLGTYLFYLAAFKEGVLDFGALLGHFFPKLRHRLIDSINPVLSAFDSGSIIDAMRPHVERIWSKLEEEGDGAGLFHLLDVFWFTKRTDTLLWIRERIDELEAESIEISSLSFEKSSNAVPSPSILGVLSSFAMAEEEEARIALDLLSRYLAKRPSEVPLLLRVFIEDYGFKPESYLRRFEIQRAVVDIVGKRAEGGEPLLSRVFLAVASEYLGTHFDTHKMKGAREVLFTRFDLPSTPELASLRGEIWKRLFVLYRSEDLKKDVLGLIGKYSSSTYSLTNSEVVKGDSEHVLPFLEKVLDPDDYRHCVMLHDYVDLLESHGTEVSEGLRERFTNDTYALAEILLPEWGERRELDLSLEDYEQYKRARLEQHTSNYTFNEYVRFFVHCLEIRNALDERRGDYNLLEGVVNTLLSLADRNPPLFLQVMEFYLQLKDPLNLNGYPLVQMILEHRDPEGAFQLLCRPEYPTKRCWLFHLQEALPAEAVNEEWLARLYALYRAAERTDLPHRFDYLLNYLPLDSRVVAKVVELVLEKAEGDAGFAHALTMLFNPHTKAAKRLPDLFADDLDLLKQAYLALERTRHHSDHNGRAFDILLDLDPNFISEYIAWRYTTAESGWLSSHDESRDYAFLWERSDYQEIMDRVVDSIYDLDKGLLFSSYPYVASFFNKNEGRGDLGEDMQKRQDAYLLRRIDERFEDLDFMAYLFGLIAQFKPKRRRQFIDRFVQRNKSFDAFMKLPLESGSWDWSGSKVPMLQEHVDYWESLLPIMNSVELLPHKQYIERQIQVLRAEIEREKKNDFIEDYA